MSLGLLLGPIFFSVCEPFCTVPNVIPSGRAGAVQLGFFRSVKAGLVFAVEQMISVNRTCLANGFSKSDVSSK